MIIKGNARGNAKWLAGHLQRTDTNELVEVLEIRGTVSNQLDGALREIVAVASGTRCRDALYHANIDPRADERLTPEQWNQAIETLEDKLGFTGQPRAVVRHIKDGREHIHVVWSRIDAEHMRAIPDSFNYRRHEEVSRELERAFGHERVQGALAERDGKPRPERTPSQAEMEQGKRTGIDPRAVKAELTEIWQHTDSGKAFAAALNDAGWCLARGERRDFVVIDAAGEVHSLARRIEGAKAKDVRERMADVNSAELPGVEEAKALQAERARARSAEIPGAEAKKERGGEGRDDNTAPPLEPSVSGPSGERPEEEARSLEERRRAEELEQKEQERKLLEARRQAEIDELRERDPRIRREEADKARELLRQAGLARQQLREKHGREWKEREEVLKAWTVTDARENQRIETKRQAEDKARHPPGGLRGLVSKVLDLMNPSRLREREALENTVQHKRAAEDARRFEARAERNATRDADMLLAFQQQERETHEAKLLKDQEKSRRELRDQQLVRHQRDLERARGKDTGRDPDGRDRGGRGGRDDDGGREM